MQGLKGSDPVVGMPEEVTDQPCQCLSHSNSDDYVDWDGMGLVDSCSLSVPGQLLQGAIQGASCLGHLEYLPLSVGEPHGVS